jgi:hypothetical protein
MTLRCAREPLLFSWREFCAASREARRNTNSHNQAKQRHSSSSENNAMAASTILNDSHPTDSSTSGSRDDTVPPSGFILKLYQMVCGAPDDMITVSFLSRSVDSPLYAKVDLLASLCHT